MKTILKITVVVGAIVLMAPKADAVLGARRRTAVVASDETKAADSAKVAQSQQQTAAAQQQTAATQQQTAASKPPAAAAPAAPPPAADGKPLPMGTVVSALPPGCVSTPVGGVEYYYGGGNFYRAVFQGNNLVYVTAQPQ